METDRCRLSVNYLDLFVGVHVLVAAEHARGNQRRIELHEDGGHNHDAHHDIEHHAVTEALAINHQQDKANREVKQGCRHECALELQDWQQQKSAACRTDNGTERVPAVDLANRGFALEGASQNQGNQRERHAGKETRWNHPEHRKRVLEQAPANVTVGSRVENLVRLVHHAPEGLVEIQRAKCEERHQDLRHRKHHEAILLEQLAARRRSQRKSQDKGGEHLVEAVARRSQQQRQQTDPDDFIDK